MKTKAIFTILLSLILSTGWGQQLTQTFSWNGLKMNYPSNYIITDKEYDPDDGGYSFSCEIDDEEVLSMVYVAFYNLEGLLDDKTTAEKQEACEDGLEEGLSGMKETISNLKSTPIKKNSSLSYPNAYSDFSYTMYGVPVQGKCVTYLKGNYMVICFMDAESSAYFKELEAIVKTISVN